MSTTTDITTGAPTPSTDEAVLTPLLGDFYGYAELLSADDQEILARVRRFAEERIAPIADQAWASTEFPYDLIPGFAELDSSASGGSGPTGPPTRKLLTSFDLAWSSRGSTRRWRRSSGCTAGSRSPRIDLCGSDEQKERWLPGDAPDGEDRRVRRSPSPTAGPTSPAGWRPPRRREGDEWVLDGEKRWIGNGTFADLVVVWARDVADDGEVKGFVVEKGTPGFTATKMEGKLALRTVQNADLCLHRRPGARGEPAAARELVQGHRTGCCA